MTQSELKAATMCDFKSEVGLSTSFTAEQQRLGSSVRQVDEKLAAVEIRFMIWSPKMDLVAAACDQHQIVLYRLNSLKKVWEFPAPSEDAEVVAMAWEPNGRLLAIAYSTCQIIIVEVERAAIHQTHHIGAAPTQLLWTTHITSTQNEPSFFKDLSDQFLPDLPSLEKENEHRNGMKQIKESDETNYLVVACDHGMINIYAFGLLSLACINLSDFISHEGKVLSACLSTTGGDLCAVTLRDAAINIVSLRIAILEEKTQEIRTVTDKFVQLANLLEYCEATIKQMEEAWEDILLEMDSKLTSFALLKQQLGGSTVLNDFLELLLFGTPSDELQTFLLKDLTDRGMKKFGVSMHNYYKTLENLILVHLQSAVEAIMYHLQDLLGLSQWKDIAALGLRRDSIEQAVQAAGSLCLKINEMLHLITASTSNMKSFCKWLYTVILRLSEHPITPDLEKSVIDYRAVADFLKDNLEGLEVKKCHVQLEKVGQYLRDCDLHFSAKAAEASVWCTIQRSPLLRDSKLVFKAEPSKSLVQLFKSLVTKTSDALTDPSLIVGKSLEGETNTFLCTASHIRKIQQFAVIDEAHGSCTYTACQLYNDQQDILYVCRQDNANKNLRKASLVFANIGGHNNGSYACSDHLLVEFDHYCNTEIAVLLRQTEDPGKFLTGFIDIAKIPEPFWQCERETTPYDVGPLMNISAVKVLENLSMARHINVSGKRKIGSVLVTKRRVRLFMYEVDTDESDQDDDNAESTKDSRDAFDFQHESSDKENAG